MRLLRIVLIACVASLAAPGRTDALALVSLDGSWRGEGSLTINDEPPQRLRCQVRIRPQASGRIYFSGRCATAQAGRGFAYMFTEGADGTVLAENNTDPIDDLPARMTGVMDDEALRFEGEAGTLFELRASGSDLVFRIEAQGPDGFARGEALLVRGAGGDPAP